MNSIKLILMHVNAINLKTSKMFLSKIKLQGHIIQDVQHILSRQ